MRALFGVAGFLTGMLGIMVVIGCLLSACWTVWAMALALSAILTGVYTTLKAIAPLVGIDVTVLEKKNVGLRRDHRRC